MSLIIASSVNSANAATFTLLMIVGFVIVLLVNRSNSPARYADEYRRQYGDPGDAYAYRDASYRDYRRDETTRGGLGMGILIFGLGAVMRYGVEAKPGGIDLHVIGTILMIVGGLSLLGSIIFYAFGRFRRRDEIR